MTGGATTGLAPGSAAETTSAPVSPPFRKAVRGWRGPLLAVLGLLVLSVVFTLLRPAPGTERPLDPDEGGLSGGRALAQLLRQNGVTVHRVTSVEEARARAGEGATLFVPDTLYLADEDATALADLPGDRVVAWSGLLDLETLAPGVKALEAATARSRDADCDLPAARRAGSAHIGGAAFSGPPGAVRCFPAGDGHSLIAYRSGDRTVTVLGGTSFMTNLRLAEDGNAALAMNLLGARSTVVWITDPVDEDGAGDPDGGTFSGEERPGLMDLVPAGVKLAAVQLVIAVLLVAVWRGRRLGPVVAERLPVVVRASETVEGRGRLYRSRRARDRAALALRTAAIDRMMPWLGLPHDAGPVEIVTAISTRARSSTGAAAEASEIGAALYGPPPEDDAGLVALADHLDRLERQVRQP
ncbi:DUF4350 domain-containing protein [Bailinhaonella thermotolerans]|uniref:DUF4350 domain-containing protein n=1 Tax=Bailinhaonella thermotolerans TaxID=1070861 RepID=A0A3A4AXA9_9ACTN|nr:DUF4350 domain-containing protein [Bailinhaonella thermotolerans]RJL30463.1 DUF4350 domain-containing protein [Bailinhaonella thermotolerans]